LATRSRVPGKPRASQIESTFGFRGRISWSGYWY
jgi:hypothetical protein